jgi:hypothetical protein
MRADDKPNAPVEDRGVRECECDWSAGEQRPEAQGAPAHGDLGRLRAAYPRRQAPILRFALQLLLPALDLAELVRGKHRLYLLSRVPRSSGDETKDRRAASDRDRTMMVGWGGAMSVHGWTFVQPIPSERIAW